MSTGRVRVLVADDQHLVREGIGSLLSLQPGIEVVGTAADGEQAVSACAELRPDVVLLDVRMPVLDGVTAIPLLLAAAPGCRVLMLTTFDDEDYVLRALGAGAVGYLLKDVPTAELAAAVRLAAGGTSSLAPAALDRLLRVTRAGDGEPVAGTPPPEDVDEVPLTERELAVLRLLGDGLTNRQIAHQLFLSEGTVKNHVSSILARLGLRHRTQAAILAHRRGLV